MKIQFTLSVEVPSEVLESDEGASAEIVADNSAYVLTQVVGAEFVVVSSEEIV